MGAILGFETGMSMPSFGTGLGSGSWFWAVLFIMFAVVLCSVAYFLIQLFSYNRKIVVFENIAGQGFQPVYKDSAKLVKLGDGGEELLYLRKKKVYRTAYGRKMGKNVYWFVIGQDGYWYNSILGDLDAKMGMLDIEPIDRDMRYMHVAVRKNITERYRKIGFMEKHGLMILSMIFLIVMIGGIWFIVDKMAETAAITGDNIKASTAVVDAAAKLLQGIDNVNGGGTGIIPAGA